MSPKAHTDHHHNTGRRDESSSASVFFDLGHARLGGRADSAQGIFLRLVAGRDLAAAGRLCL